MLTILPAPDHVAAYRLSQTLTAEDLDAVMADIEARLSRHEKLGILADLTDFTDMTLAAAWKDARYGISKLWELNRFPREAVITDKGWLTSFVELLSPAIPFVTVRAFKPEDYGKALAWAGDIEGGPNA
ncbi:STAS/SEC14 domain-containing protein [Bosea sp. (in: a-proteobacteria)]|uniref:STAS/SEC14 domain-containing protein n=1 Tax=Bosea sp. (in: a-proteobacteria) TaxID=1871050 RepID=UPI002601AF55|nr:STAS/SEC14 domain-containing protein [Bosea sp. (in: a-proteobacteria)]MCO5091439.1 STAS/SEC14 domain-containing protein [Bosea sp. (in: a-proteobacteria)]